MFPILPHLVAECLNDLKNNKIITTTFNNITANNYDVDILPLKNQLNAEGKGTKNNIFNEDIVTHRKYTKLHTGTNQELGTHNVFAGYNWISSYSNISFLLFKNYKNNLF